MMEGISNVKEVLEMFYAVPQKPTLEFRPWDVVFFVKAVEDVYWFFFCFKQPLRLYRN